MNFQDITKLLSSKDVLEQTNAIEQIKTYISESSRSADEHFFISILSNLLELGSDKKHQSEIESLCELFINIINPYAFEFVFQEISKVFTSVKFQSKVIGLKIICNYAKLYPHVISSNLYLVIEALIQLSSDIKKEVKTAVFNCWVAICETIENVDIKPIISVMIDGYINPSTKTESSLEKLASTPFVNDIDIRY
jgi:hypothetical protein